MRCALNRSAAIITLCSLWLASALAEPEEPPPPEVVEEREFHPPKRTAGDYLAAPFHIPRSLIYALLFPLDRTSKLVWDNDVPDRVKDILSDDTKRIWFIPTAVFSTNEGFSGGGTFRFDDMFYQKKNLRIMGLLQVNLDRTASGSFDQEARPGKPVFYRIAAKHKLNTDANYYGRGIDSKRSDKSKYTHEYNYLTFQLGIQIPNIPSLKLSGVVGYEHSSTRSSAPETDDQLVEETFSPLELVGFGQQISWIRYGLDLRYDSRPEVGNPYRGVLVYLGAERYENPENRFSHLQLSSGISALFNLYQRTSVLVLELHFESTEDFSPSRTPFYDLATLDKHSPLRGYPNGRFHDTRNLVGNIEYRFLLWQSVNPDPVYGLGTLFFDMGKPFDDLESLTSGGVLYSVGIGFILASAANFLGRAHLAYGGEQVETMVSISRAF